MTGSPKLSGSKLHKAFGGVKVIDGCTFEVKPGTITGLIGPNGAGKSTLFNLVTGIIHPDAGEICLDSADVSNVAAARLSHLGLSRTFQIPRELKRLSVRENLMLAAPGQRGENLVALLASFGRVGREERELRQRADEVLRRIGLLEKAEIPAEHLSGGQKKLLELGRCLMTNPSVVLLDEPMAGVSPVLIKDLVAVIRTLHDDGITLFVIEHNMNVVMQLCSQVIVLDHGKVLAEGSPKEVQSDPRVVRAYLGGAQP